MSEIKDNMTSAQFREMVKAGTITRAKPHNPKGNKNSGGNATFVKDAAGIITVSVKPLSVNEAYTGRRFATDSLKAFRKELGFALKPIQLPPPPYAIHFVFGQSNPGADWDGGIKAAQDVIAKRYGFNDKLIRKGTVEIDLVEKGKEYISFNITHFKATKP